MSRGQAVAIALLGTAAAVVWAVTIAWAWPASAERTRPPEPARYCAAGPAHFLPCRMVWVEVEA